MEVKYMTGKKNTNRFVVAFVTTRRLGLIFCRRQICTSASLSKDAVYLCPATAYLWVPPQGSQGGFWNEKQNTLND